jgi:hypothetical protein
VAVTISVTKDRGDDGAASTGETFGLASADDKGPVSIITEDPSCTAWGPIVRTLAQEQRNGWDQRDRSIPATQWTPAQRTQYEEVAGAMRRAADQSVPLVKVTPHRVMRELYQQFIAYAHAYVDAIPTYSETDNLLAGVAGGISNALTDICTAISYGSAEARAPLVDAPPNPTAIEPPTEPGGATLFLSAVDRTCPDLIETLEQFDEDTAEWQAMDSNVPASDWNPEQRKIIEGVIPVMTGLAHHLDELGLRSNNPTLQDFALLAAQYRRAYANVLPSYSTPDSYLAAVSADITSAVADACRASDA